MELKLKKIKDVDLQIKNIDKRIKIINRAIENIELGRKIKVSYIQGILDISSLI